MDVMQPHSGHSYSSWAISSFVRRGGVYLMRCRDARVALVANARPGVWSAAFGTRGLPFELAGLAQDRRGPARFAQDEGEECPAAGAAGAEIFDVLRHGRASHRLSAESRRGEERGL